MTGVDRVNGYYGIGARGDPLFKNPGHLVHPMTGDHMLFDVYGVAICPHCSARWRRVRNVTQLVEQG